MAEEIDFENGRNSNFEGLVTLTLTFDPAIRHVVLHQSSTSSYIPNFIQIEETFCGRTDVRMDIFPLYIIKSTLGSRPKKVKISVFIQRSFFCSTGKVLRHGSRPGSHSNLFFSLAWQKISLALVRFLAR